MPVLGRQSTPEPGVSPYVRAARGLAGLFPVCANPCCRSGWLHLWRGRQTPAFEGGWTCSPECMRERIRCAAMRELDGRDEMPSNHSHRVPLGLVLLSQGAISREQLKSALALQRGSHADRLGQVLMDHYGLGEPRITRALSAQWNCPILSPEHHSPQTMAPLVPRLFLDAFRILPLRVARSRIFYIAFEDRIDRCVALGLERMTGFEVEAGVMDGAAFRGAHSRMLASSFPPTRLVEVAGVDALIATLTRVLEDCKPAEARLVRFHDYFWMRMWKDASFRSPSLPRRQAVEDVLCSIEEFR